MAANDFKIFLTVSFLLHAGIVALFSFHARRVTVTMPVELSYFTPAAPSGGAPAPVAAPSASKPAPAPKKEEIALPKKAAPQKRKETPAPEPAPAETPSSRQQEGEGRSSGLANAREGTPGSPISAEASNFPYPYYLNSIKKKIDRTWQWSGDYGRLKAVVYFRIARDGTVSSAEIRTSSGDRYFDQQAQRAVMIANPFPPLPDGYRDNDLGIFFEFRTDAR